MGKKYFSFPHLLLVCLLALSLFGMTNQALAIETTFPSVPNAAAPTATSDLPQYILYGFWFIIAIAGLVALFSIAFGGFKILLFPNDPSVRSDAWDRILNAALGLGLLFVTVILLTTINPSLTKLNFGDLAPVEGPVEGRRRDPSTPLPATVVGLPLLSPCTANGVWCSPPGVCIGSTANIFGAGYSTGTCRDVVNPGPTSCLTSGADCMLRPGATDLPCCNRLTCRFGFGGSGILVRGTCR